MLIAKQLKKSNNNIRYEIYPPPQQPGNPKVYGSKLKNIKKVKDKLSQNFSQFPIELSHEKKQNNSLSNIMINRPYSSLVGSDVSASVSKSKQKNDRSLAKKKKFNKKGSTKKTTIGIQLLQQKQRQKYIDLRKRRLSGTSQNQRNNRSVDDDLSILKSRLAENRKKYNLSCGQMMQNASKSKNTRATNKKKTSQKIPKTAINKKQKILKKEGKQNKEKSPTKSKTKFKKISVRPSQPAFKSKGSTVGVGKDKKKKQEKEKKKSKQKERKGKKQIKYFVFSKSQTDKDQSRSDDYPINKYLINKKGDTHDYSNINYNSSLNIISGSSDIIRSSECSIEKAIDFNRKKNEDLFIDNYVIEAQDINLKEIRFYEDHSPLKKKKKFSQFKRTIEQELLEEYFELSEEELNFLVSVTIIQRRWRQFRLKNRFRKKKSKKNEQDFGAKETALKETRLNSLIINQPQETSISYGQIYNVTQQSPEINSRLDISQVEVIGEGNSSFQQFDDESSHGKQIQKLVMTERQGQRTYNRKTYFNIFEKQIFPELTYIEYRKKILRQNFQKTVKQIYQQYTNKLLNEEELEGKKDELKVIYDKEIDSLKRDKHDIKKGYLKYIDCLNKTKQFCSKSSTLEKDNNYGIRKVSSQDGFISTLYERIFKFDKCISEVSDQSQSIELLTKKVLIRKQFFANDSINLTSRSIEELRQINYAQHDHSKELKPTPVQSQQIKSFQLSNRQDSKNLDLSSFSKSVELVKKEPALSPSQLQKFLPILQNQFILNLTFQLQRELSAIDPNLIVLLLAHMRSSKVATDSLRQDISFNQSPAFKALNQEFSGLNSPTDIAVPISPISERKVLVDYSDITFYLRQLISHIKQWNWVPQIINSMNQNQGFTPFLYLKFLRDYDIPDQEYSPIISNERFITWQTYYVDTFQPQKQKPTHRQIVRQCKTIFHRCIFQVFLSQLQKKRPYGEKGKPMPWEESYSSLMEKRIKPSQINKIFNESFESIEDVLSYNCGVIIQKHFYFNEEELERIHEENEDRIIEMLEQDLKETPHDWYQIEEHSLQLKLDLSFYVENQLFEECLNQLIGQFM